MIVSVHSLPPQAFFSIENGSLTTHSHHSPETLYHTDLSSTIIDGRIPTASRALSIPSRIPTTIAATIARTCCKKTTGKTRLYVREDFPLELRDWGIPRNRERRQAMVAVTVARGRWLKKKVKRSFSCRKYDSLPARDVDREFLD